MPFKFEKTKLGDVIIIKPKIFEDNRGFFLENYKKSEFVANGIDIDFIQDNHSKSTKGVLRGLHYQTKPKAQAKLIRCTRGKIFDVAVDIRQSSPSFGMWAGEILSEENKHMLFIPEGFAHGFVVLSDVAELCYKSSAEYSAQNDRGIYWNDLGIDWNLDFEPILSEKDKNQPLLKTVKSEDLF